MTNHSLRGAAALPWTRIAVIGGWLLLGQLSQSQSVRAQTPSELAAADGPAEFSVIVHDPRESAQRIKVARNRQVVIETSEEFARVEATSADIVRLDPISETQLLVTGQSYGVTQVILWTASGKQHVFEVNVELDLELLNQTIRDFDPLSDAKAVSVMGNILLTGTVTGTDIATQIESMASMFVPRVHQDSTTIFNLLRVSGEQQVLLKCVVAEVSRTAAKRLGVNWFLAGETARDGFIVNQVGGFQTLNFQPAAGVNVRQRIPFITGDMPISKDTTLTLGFPRADLAAFIRALSENQLSRILAEPTMVATSGETASFLVGGEFPIPIPQSRGNGGAITIEFKEFGVNLTFTPLVLPNQRIRLTVRPEISARDEARGLVTGTGFVPAIITRRADTTVELESGSTISIAGLLQDEIRGVATTVPGIGEVPILGALFRSVDYQRSRTELVILVTPEIISPMNPGQIESLPGEDVFDPNDLELYLLGSLEGRPRDDNMDAGTDGEPIGADSHQSQGKWPSDPDQLSLHGPWGPAPPADSMAKNRSSSSR
jgi:pilus assembly protein CpaC